MNKEVFDLYKKLNDTERSELVFRFKDSPVGLKFLNFLEQKAARNFKNFEAVNFIYDPSSAAYNVLENRYFKLRKKVNDELVDLTTTKDTEYMLLADEEQRLYKAKSHALAENKESAYKELTELEKECWQKNIFELLPTIIDLLIFLNQAFNRNEKNEELLKRYQKAIDLLYDIERVSLNARTIYQINFSKGVKYASKQLNTIKEIAQKNKTYPRFAMCYHHISLYYKLGSVEYYGNMQVVSRHMSAFKKLFANNPLIPLINYRVNYVKYQHFHFANSTMFYHFNRCEFQDALACIEDVWDMVHSEDSIFRIYKTESLYSNMFTLQCMAEKYDEASKTSDLFINFLKENNQSDALPFAYTQKMRLYTDLYPSISKIKIDKGFLIEQLDEYIKKVKKENNLLFPYDQALVLRLRVYVIEKEYKKALAVYNDPIVKTYLASVGMDKLYKDLLNILIENSYEKWHQLLVLNKKLLQTRYKLKTPGEHTNLNWLIHFCKHHKS